MKKVILILALCFCFTGLVNSQNYANKIQLQSVTDTVTRPIPVNAEITLRDSSKIYLITASQPVGTSMSEIIAAGEYKILSNNKVRWDSIYATISNVEEQLGQKLDTVTRTDPASYIDSVGAVMPPRTIITDNDTLLITDLGKTLWVDSEFDVTIVIPLNVFPVTAGATLTLFRWGAGEVTVVIVAGGTLNAPGGRTSINLQYDAASLTQQSVNSWVMNGGTK